MIKVLVVDDHAVVRAGLRQILKETKDITVAGEARDGQEALEKARSGSWDLILLDIAMPGQNGLEVLKQLRAAHPRTPVLIMSMHPEDQYGVRVLKGGAAGYLTKDSAPELLETAIRKVLAGGKFISPELAEKLAFNLEVGPEPLHETLSDREDQVFRMIASGKAVSGIAGDLCLSVKTVSTHRARILGKMKLKNNAELTRYAFENKLVI
jgi:DNA-binding NarL/FixJ family response regulator